MCVRASLTLELLIVSGSPPSPQGTRLRQKGPTYQFSFGLTNSKATFVGHLSSSASGCPTRLGWGETPHNLFPLWTHKLQGWFRPRGEDSSGDRDGRGQGDEREDDGSGEERGGKGRQSTSCAVMPFKMATPPSTTTNLSKDTSFPQQCPNLCLFLQLPNVLNGREWNVSRTLVDLELYSSSDALMLFELKNQQDDQMGMCISKLCLSQSS